MMIADDGMHPADIDAAGDPIAGCRKDQGATGKEEKNYT
jgi:hypothetical protein